MKTSRPTSALVLTSTKRFGVGLAATGLAFSLTACNDDKGDGSAEGTKDSGSDSGSLAPAEAVQAAARGFESESYAATLTMDLNGSPFMDGSMEFVDDKNNKSDTKIMMSAIVDNMDTSDMSAEEQQMMDEMMGGLFQDVESSTVMVDGEVYMQMSADEAWVHMTAEEMDALMAQAGAEQKQVDIAGDANAILEELDDVEEVGDNEYEGTLKAGGEATGDLFTALGEVSASDTVVTVKLDDQDRLDELSFAIDMTSEQAGVLKSDFTIDVTEWGGDYDIQAPSGETKSWEEYQQEMMDTMGQ
ncbi:hypothetical protein [Salininema proteolyticum]|uniref:Lipoprotein n=1 Tax=Salininema proteolyticum TaxID=1607685 RepID=A0ABV8TWF0_9ACTN